MSCYEWERGEIVIPAREWADVKMVVRDAYNAHQSLSYKATLWAWEQISGDPPRMGKGVIPELLIGDLFREEVDGFGRRRTVPVDLPDGARILPEHVDRMALFSMQGGRERLRKPTKSAFPLASNRTTVFHKRGWTIRFDDGTRTVHWKVEENNHAVEQAREHPVPRALFDRLARVRWTRDSGGQIWGNNEYNEDAGQDYPGGGGSMVNDRFGPLGGSLQEDMEAMLRFSGPSGPR